MGKLLWLFLFVCSFSNVFCQNNLPPVYEIRTDTASVKIPDSSWQMLEDQERKFTIDQVSQSPLTEKFHSNTRVQSSVNTYWVRFRVKNDMNHEAKLSFNNRSASFLDVFLKQQDSSIWQHKRTGYLLPLSKKDGLREINIIPFFINPGSELWVYERMKFESRLYQPKNVSVSFNFKTSRDDYTGFYEAIYFQRLRQAVLFGICMLATIFSFFFFLTTRERVYFHASMLDFSLALFTFMDPLRDILFQEHPGIRDYGLPVVIAFMLYFQTSTFRYALNTKRLFPLLNKLLLIVGILPFPLVLAAFSLPTPFFHLYFALPFWYVLFFLSISITCFSLMRRRNKTRQLLMAGVSFFSLYEIVILLPVILNVPLPLWLTNYQDDIEFLFYLSLIIIST